MESFVALKNLEKKTGGFLLWNSSLHFHHLGEVASWTKLGDDIAVIGSVEGIDVPEDVWMLNLPEALYLCLKHSF